MPLDSELTIELLIDSEFPVEATSFIESPSLKSHVRVLFIASVELIDSEVLRPSAYDPLRLVDLPSLRVLPYPLDSDVLPDIEYPLFVLVLMRVPSVEPRLVPPVTPTVVSTDPLTFAKPATEPSPLTPTVTLPLASPYTDRARLS
jgi:hypothetical protein